MVPIFVSGESDLVRLGGRLLESGRTFRMNLESGIDYLDIPWMEGTFDDIPFAVRVKGFRYGVFQVWITLDSCPSCGNDFIFKRGRLRMEGRAIEGRLYDVVVSFLSWLIAGQEMGMEELVNVSISPEKLSSEGLEMIPVGREGYMINTGTVEYVLSRGESVSIGREGTFWRLELADDENLWNEAAIYIYGHILAGNMGMYFMRWSERVRLYMKNIRDNGMEALMYRLDDLIQEKMNFQMSQNMFQSALFYLNSFYRKSRHSAQMEQFIHLTDSAVENARRLISHISAFYDAINPGYDEPMTGERKVQDTITFLGVLGGVGAVMAAFLTGGLDIWARIILAILLISIPLGFVWMERRIRKNRMRKAYMSYLRSRMNELEMEERRLVNFMERLQALENVDEGFREMLLRMYGQVLGRLRKERDNLEME